MSRPAFWERIRADQATADHREAIDQLNWLSADIDILVDLGKGKARLVPLQLLREWSEVVAEAVALLGDGERP
jgi:hypothetical protein